MFQFSFIGCTDTNDSIEAIDPYQEEYSLTPQDFELIDFISKSYHQALSESLAVSSDMKSFEKNFTNGLNKKSFVSTNKTETIYRITNPQEVYSILDQWQINVSDGLDRVRNDRNSIIQQIEFSKRNTLHQILNSRLTVDEKRIAHIFVNSYTNILISTVDQYLNGGKGINFFLEGKCNFWKRLKWILKCTALSVKAGVECIAAAKDIDWSKGSKCVLAGIAAIDCWTGGCK